jgi:hypothetical protein
MTPRLTGMMLVALTWLSGCQCANGDIVVPDSETTTSESEATVAESSFSSGTTGEPFDPSPWLGRYHYENVYLPFGERGDSHGSNALVNFEILPGSRATIFYDDCAFDEPVTRNYEWSPGEEGWLTLQPGPGEPWLRFLGDDSVDTLRVQLIEPCRELRFEVDGTINTALKFYPGESCWVDRCTAPNIMQVDYCEGEEPPPCP